MVNAKQALLAFGPIASIAAGMAFLQGYEVGAFSWAMLILWSPLPVGIPALIMQRDRDDALPGISGTSRAILMFPHLILERRSRDAAVSIAGWAATFPLVLSL